jgi:hypothetical protein
MRYTPETRINNPSAEYVKLWTALDNLHIPFTKICRVLDADKVTDYRENWTIPAMLELSDDYQFENAGIEFKQCYYLNGNGMSMPSLSNRKRLLDYCSENNIPVLLISRKKGLQEMTLSIRKWLDQLKKEV